MLVIWIVVSNVFDFPVFWHDDPDWEVFFGWFIHHQPVNWDPFEDRNGYKWWCPLAVGNWWGCSCWCFVCLLLFTVWSFTISRKNIFSWSSSYLILSINSAAETTDTIWVVFSLSTVSRNLLVKIIERCPSRQRDTWQVGWMQKPRDCCLQLATQCL